MEATEDGFNIRGLNTAAHAMVHRRGWNLGRLRVSPVRGSGHCRSAVTNLLLRPLAQKINRTPSENTEEEILYRFRCTCRAPQEAHVRALLLQNVGPTPLTLIALHSKDHESLDRVDVKAFLKTVGRKDEFLENIVTRLSLEASVTAISWEVVASVDPEDTLLTNDKLVDVA
jgi:putative Mg2+ transporter-C (MgtC) family protein